jgi:hypothetical protein
MASAVKGTARRQAFVFRVETLVDDNHKQRSVLQQRGRSGRPSGRRAIPVVLIKKSFKYRAKTLAMAFHATDLPTPDLEDPNK